MKNSKPTMTSRISFGGASLGGDGGGYSFGSITKISAMELIDRAVDLGITSFDTAPIYGFGDSERLLGEGLRKHRDKIHILTKGGVSWHSNMRVNMSNDPKIISSMLEDSLKRINLDYIDTYLLHYPDPKVDIRYPLEILIKAKEKGDIKNIGLSNTHAEDISKAAQICEVSIIQNECNLFKNSFIPLDKAHMMASISTMGWGTLDKGILSSRVFKSRQYDDSDFRSWAPWWKKSNWKQRVSRVEKFKIKYPEINLKKLALEYSLSNVDSIICGAKSLSDLEELYDLACKPMVDFKSSLEKWSSI